MARRTEARTVAFTSGMQLAPSGFIHGPLEALQGREPVPGRIIAAIGPARRFRVHGAEPAFTLLPNFVSAGFATMSIAFLRAALVLLKLAFPLALAARADQPA